MQFMTFSFLTSPPQCNSTRVT